jgi:hypothetical protein
MAETASGLTPFGALNDALFFGHTPEGLPSAIGSIKDLHAIAAGIANIASDPVAALDGVNAGLDAGIDDFKARLRAGDIEGAFREGAAGVTETLLTLGAGELVVSRAGGLAGALGSARLPRVSLEFQSAAELNLQMNSIGSGMPRVRVSPSAVRSYSRLPRPYRSFETMDAFKAAFGRAGDDLDWHHIVEQHDGNIARFGAQAIHNTDNIVVIDRAVHHKINGYYGSIQPRVTGSTTLTVREWLSTQSLSAHRSFGERVLRRYGGS